MYKDNLLDILIWREGGLADLRRWVIAAVISVLVLAKVKHLSAPQIFDTIAMALLNGQMLGRWGNFLTGKRLGIYGQSVCDAPAIRCSALFRCDGADAPAYRE